MSILDIFHRGLVGLDIGVSGIKAVELSPGKTRRLMAYNRVPLPWNSVSADGEIKNREVVLEALRVLFASNHFSTRRIVTAGFGNSIITKKIQVDRMKPEDLEEQIYWEAEQYIPFDVNDVNLDFAIIGNHPGTSAGKMDVLLVAAKKDYIQTLQDLFAEAELQVQAIDTQAFALGNAFEYNYAHLINSEAAKQICVLVDFGAGSTKVSLFENDKTLFNRELRQCGLSCTSMISERLGVSLEEAEALKIEKAEDASVTPLIDEYVAAITDEVSRTIDFSLTQSTDMAVDGVFVCGGASKTRGLVKSLENRLSAPIKRLNPIQFIAGSGKKMSPAVVTEITNLGSLAVGLALRTGGSR